MPSEPSRVKTVRGLGLLNLHAQGGRGHSAGQRLLARGRGSEDHLLLLGQRGGDDRDGNDLAGNGDDLPESYDLLLSGRLDFLRHGFPGRDVGRTEDVVIEPLRNAEAEKNGRLRKPALAQGECLRACAIAAGQAEGDRQGGGQDAAGQRIVPARRAGPGGGRERGQVARRPGAGLGCNQGRTFGTRGSPRDNAGAAGAVLRRGGWSGVSGLLLRGGAAVSAAQRVGPRGGSDASGVVVSAAAARISGIPAAVILGKRGPGRAQGEAKGLALASGISCKGAGLD